MNSDQAKKSISVKTLKNRHVKMNYAPEIQAEIASYTWGEFETRSELGEPIQEVPEIEPVIDENDKRMQQSRDI